MKARLLSLLHRSDGTGRHASTHQATQDTQPDPAVVARLRELDAAGYSIDYLIDAAAQMRNARTARTSR